MTTIRRQCSVCDYPHSAFGEWYGVLIRRISVACRCGFAVEWADLLCHFCAEWARGAKP